MYSKKMWMERTNLFWLGIVFLMVALASGRVTIGDCPAANWTVYNEESCFIDDAGDVEYIWMDAYTRCTNNGWQLPSIHSEEENQFVADFRPGYGVWIGLRLLNMFDDILTWSDGSAVEYSSFAERCSSFHADSNTFTFIPYEKEQGGYICKYPIGLNGLCQSRTHSTFNGSCYVFNAFWPKGTWDQADAICQNDYNGELASIHSIEEENFIKNRTSSELSTEFVFFGLLLNNSYPFLRWSDGSETNYLPTFVTGVGFHLMINATEDKIKWLPGNPPNLTTACEFTPVLTPTDITCDPSSITISLSADDKEELCVNETDKIVVSPDPFFVAGVMEPKCTSDFSDAMFYFNLTDCYPDVQKYGNNLKFTWSVRKLVVVEPGKPVIRFDEDKCLELCCWYDATELITSDEIDPEIRKIVVGSGSGSGSFSIEMTLYGEEDLTTELTEDDDVEVPDTIYAVVDLEIADSDERFVVQMEDCWATPSDDPCDPIDYPLITEGCANKSDPGAMVEVTRNYKPTYGTFQFNSFLWVYDPEDPIYVHCKVRICDNEEYNCSLECDDDRDKRDLSHREEDSKDVFSYGPIYVHSNKPSCFQNNGGCSDICTMLDNDVIECSCPLGKSLMRDEKSCQEVSKTKKLNQGQEMETTMMLAILLFAFVMLIISGGMMWKTRLMKANLPQQFA